MNDKKSMFESQNCGGCNYFFVTEHNDNEVKPKANVGQCRKNCPTVVTIPQNKIQAVMNPVTKQIEQIPVQEITLQPVYPPLKATDKGCAQHSRFDR